MSKRIVVLVGSLAAALAGGWLILAPFALGYRRPGAPWNHPTEVDVWSGVGVVAISLVCLVASTAAVRAELRARGALPPTRAERRAAKQAEEAQAAAEADGASAAEGAAVPGAAPGEAEPPPAPADLRELLAPLVQALLVDLDDHDRSAEGPENHHRVPAAPQPTRRSYT